MAKLITLEHIGDFAEPDDLHEFYEFLKLNGHHCYNLQFTGFVTDADDDTVDTLYTKWLESR